MMTFKELYLRSAKGAKAPRPRPWKRFKTHKMQEQILDWIAKLKAAKCWPNVDSKHSTKSIDVDECR